MPPDPQVLRDSRASDRTKIDDSSQPSSVARLSHHNMSWPPGACGSGYQVARWSSEISGTTVSIAYSTGLKQRTWPSPHESARGELPLVPGTGTAGRVAARIRPVVEYTSPLLSLARSVLWPAGSIREAATSTSSTASSHRTRVGRYP